MSKDFLELAKDRFSVRKFSNKAIEQEKIDLILRAGQLAPTACNNQPQRIICVNDEESLSLLRKCTECHYNCTYALIVCYDKDVCWKRSYDGHNSGDVDAAIVTTHMMLEAANLGVGSTWVMHYIPEAIKVEFELPDNLESTAILVMGYPADDAVPNPRHSENKSLDELVKFL